MDAIRQIISGFSIVSVLLLLQACGEERKSHPSLAEIAKASQAAIAEKHRSEWHLSEGQTVLVSSGETLTLLRVIEDSRYSGEALSVSDGRVLADFLLISPDGKRRKFSLGLGNALESSVVIEGHAIQLLSISPPPAVSKKGNYKAHLKKSLATASLQPTVYLEGLRLASLYQPELGVVELEFLHGEASLIRDPNRCRIDVFGDRSACSKMAVYRSTVGFRFMEYSLDKYLYRLTGVEGISFVIDKSFEYPTYRLIIEQDGRAEVIALLPVQKVKQLPARY